MIFTEQEQLRPSVIRKTNQNRKYLSSRDKKSLKESDFQNYSFAQLSAQRVHANRLTIKIQNIVNPQMRLTKLTLKDPLFGFQKVRKIKTEVSLPIQSGQPNQKHFRLTNYNNKSEQKEADVYPKQAKPNGTQPLKKFSQTKSFSITNLKGSMPTADSTPNWHMLNHRISTSQNRLRNKLIL